MNNPLKYFVEKSMFCIAMFDNNMCYLATSEVWLQNYLIKDDIIGKNHYDIFPNHPDHWIEAHRAGLRGETVIKIEEETEYPRGIHEWVRWHVLPWYLNDNDIGGILLTTEDITERKQREKELNTVLGRFELIQQAAKIGMWDWNISEQQIVLNAEYYEILGRNNKHSIGYDDFLNMIHPEDISRVMDSMNNALNGGASYSSEFRIYRENDIKLRWIKDQGHIEFNDNGAPVRAYGAIIDVTEHKKLSEEHLRSAGEEYQKFMNTMMEGVWAIDRNAITTFVNNSMAEMLGYSEEEMLGNSLYSYMDDKWRKIAINKFSERSDGKSERHEFMFKHKDGSEVWCLVGANPIIENDEFIGAVAVLTSINDRKKLEEQKSKKIAELENKIIDLETRLNRSSS